MRLGIFGQFLFINFDRNVQVFDLSSKERSEDVTGSLSEMWLGHKLTHDRLIPSKLHNDFLRRAGSARAGWPQRRMRRSHCAQYARRAAHCAGRKPQPRLFPVPRVSRPSAESAVRNMGRVFHGLSEAGTFVTDRDEGAEHDALPFNWSTVFYIFLLLHSMNNIPY